MSNTGIHTKPNNGQIDSWITPRFILDVLGEFDLDPCACKSQPWLTATRNLILEDDGLSVKWFGRIWLNPPYGQAISKWMVRMASHNNGIALVMARTETRWFCESVWGKASGLLFLHKRLHFHYPTGKRASGNSGGPSVLIAYGKQDAEVLRTCSLKGSYVEEVQA